ncbi:hypothetical protein BsWGS_07620 [Bradybaena similaris]
MAFSSCLPFPRKRNKKNPETIKTCKLLVVGDKDSGKTSLIFRFSRDRLPSDFERRVSVLDTDCMDVIRNGEQIHLYIYDTPGDNDYAKCRALFYNQVDGIIICLSLDSPESLRHVELEWGPEIRHLCHNKPFFLVGTKKDLRDNVTSRLSSYESLSMPRFVTKKQGKQMAKSIGATAYLECTTLDSNRKGKDVKRVFGRAVREFLKRH